MKEEVKVTEVWPLAVVDQILTDYLALPAIKPIVDILPLPKRVLKALDLPTLDELSEEILTKVKERLERVIK